MVTVIIRIMNMTFSILIMTIIEIIIKRDEGNVHNVYLEYKHQTSYKRKRNILTEIIFYRNLFYF